MLMLYFALNRENIRWDNINKIVIICNLLDVVIVVGLAKLLGKI